MSKPIILLLLELTLFHNLYNYDLIFSFGVTKGPYDNSYFQHETLSFIETAQLMEECSWFYLCAMDFTLLQMFNMLETPVFRYQNERVFPEMNVSHLNLCHWMLWLDFFLFWKRKQYHELFVNECYQDFVICIIAFIVSVAVFLPFSSDANDKVCAGTQEMLLTSQNMLTTDAKCSESNDRN